MNLRSAQTLIAAHLLEQFGQMVVLRGVRVMRQAAGRLWVGDAYRLTPYGDVRVGSVTVDEEARVTADFGADELIGLFAHVKAGTGLPPAPGDEESLVELVRDDPRATVVPGAQELDQLEEYFAGLDTPGLRREIRALLRSGDRRDLVAARDKLPLLLPDPDGRGEVLRQMAELELLLGDVDVGLTFLEAAARELADRADVRALELVASRTRDVLGRERFAHHPTRQLLDATRLRLRPVPELTQAPLLAGLDQTVLAQVESAAELVGLTSGEVLIREEATPIWAFVIRSGVLSIWVEPFTGGPRFVRCCFPGELVGESSVLGRLDASATATVRVDASGEAWRFSGFQLRALAEANPELAARVEDTGLRHRLDSFFSVGDAKPALDVRVRDRLLSCLIGIRAVAADEVILAAGQVPEVACLVARGGARLRSEHSTRTAGPNAFVGLRNALHEVPLDGDWVATSPTHILAFDGARLRALAAAAPPEVAGVLEALE